MFIKSTKIISILTKCLGIFATKLIMPKTGNEKVNENNKPVTNQNTGSEIKLLAFVNRNKKLK
jgi:hypothetical protein